MRSPDSIASEDFCRFPIVKTYAEAGTAEVPESKNSEPQPDPLVEMSAEAPKGLPAQRPDDRLSDQFLKNGDPNGARRPSAWAQDATFNLKNADFSRFVIVFLRFKG